MTMTKRRGNGDSEELASYYQQIKCYPPLTRAEEHSWAMRARKGEVLARQKLVQHNLAFVIVIARKQRRGTVRLDDLIQEGNLGLLRAVEKFDPHAGTRFLTYAAWWIRAFIGRYLMRARSSVRPTGTIVAQDDLSLDRTIGDEDDRSYLELVEDDAPDPEESCLRSETDREVRDALGKVRKRIGKLGWDIVQSRLSQDAPDTLEDIGKRGGVSRERVRQVEKKTTRFLQRYLRAIEPALSRDAA